MPEPSWAKGEKVHFEPAEPRNHGLAHGEATASSTYAGPLTSPSPRLQYHGGLVESEPRLVLVFMGKQWEDYLSLRHELEATAESLPGSAYQEILTQYGGLDGPISSPLIGSPVIETYYDERAITTRIDSAVVVQEGEEVIQLTGASRDTNATYAVMPAPGTAEVEEFICGFHEEYGGNGTIFTPGPSIAVIMDTEARAGCITSKTLTHEYAESVTDPDSSGWNTGARSEDEIADICNGLGPGRLTDGALVARLWDDSKSACEIEDTTPGSVPIGPYTETSRRNPSLEGSTNETVETEKLETSIYPCDLEAHYYFEYGTTTAYGSRTPESVVPASWGGVKVNATVTGLQHNTPYHWRVVITTSNGTAEGVDHEFTIPYNVEIKEKNATGIGLSEATLHGEVNPVGVEAKYYFEYGTSEEYGSSTPEVSAGSGVAFVKASAVLAGLQLGTVYHFRLVAYSSHGTTIGNDQEFETHGGKPAIETKGALSIGYTEAELNARIDAKGTPTTFYFEYGTSEEYGSSTPEVSAGSGVAFVSKSAALTGLAPGTLYHYRVLATNSYGTTYGADQTFSTGVEPSVQTGVPVTVGSEEATLGGTINPHGAEVAYYFEYGLTPEYGMRTAQASAGSGDVDVEASKTIADLAPGVTYRYRIVAVYGSIMQYGSEVTFTTTALPPPVITTGPGPVLDETPLPPAPGQTPSPRQAPSPPSVRNARQSATKWRESNRLARVSRAKTPTGTTFSFSLSEQATFRFSFMRLLRGSRVLDGCIAKAHKQTINTICNTAPAATLSFTGHAGANRVIFAGRLSHTSKLKPGRYELTITATNSTGQRSTPVSLSFTIVK